VSCGCGRITRSAQANADTAALIDELDIIVSIDTAAMHVADDLLGLKPAQ
jgi:hypothetical protein